MNEKKKTPQTIEEKIKIAIELKEEGNKYFKENQLKKALYSYKKVNKIKFKKTKIFLYLNGLNSSLSDILSRGNSKKEKTKEEIEIDEIRLIAYLNISAVYIKLNEYKKAKENVYKALQFDENNIKGKNIIELKKGIFRRGQCRMELGELDLAESDFNYVIEKNPDDSLVKKEIEILKKKMILRDKKEKTLFTNMFKS
jgi:tetratricopeptide (TPR) repeat protein